MLFGCIYAPDFPVQSSLLGDPDSFLSNAAVVLDGPETLLKVIACNDPARAAGVAIGMTKLQGESCGVVLLHKRVAEQEEPDLRPDLHKGYTDLREIVRFTAARNLDWLLKSIRSVQNVELRAHLLIYAAEGWADAKREAVPN